MWPSARSTSACALPATAGPGSTGSAQSLAAVRQRRAEAHRDPRGREADADRERDSRLDGTPAADDLRTARARTSFAEPAAGPRTARRRGGPAAEAVRLCAGIDAEHPGGYRPELAAALVELSACLDDAGRPPRRSRRRQEALDIRRLLAERNRGRYTPEVGTLHGARLRADVRRSTGRTRAG